MVFFQGKKGDSPTKKDIAIAQKLQTSLASFQNKNCRANDKIRSTYNAYNTICSVVLTGNPEQDWKSIRDGMENGCCELLKEVAQEAKNVRLLRKGKFIRETLANSWRDYGCYHNAVEMVRISFQQEHLAVSTEEPRGVFIMNIHKAKGKEFDEVILFEGHNQYKDRFVHQNDKKNINSSNRQVFMVGVTRARKQATIMTPQNDPCVLLLG